MKHSQINPSINYKANARTVPAVSAEAGLMQSGTDDQSRPAEPSPASQSINWHCNACGHPSPRPLAIPIKAFCALIGCGRTSQWKLEKLGQIETRNVLGRKVVLTRSIDKLLDL